MFLILDRQLKYLINKEIPNLYFFYNSLKKKKLVSEKKVQKLYTTFLLNVISTHKRRECYELIQKFSIQNAMLQDILNVVINELIKEIDSRVLNKYKLEDDDSIVMNNEIKLFYNIFRRLH